MGMFGFTLLPQRLLIITTSQQLNHKISVLQDIFILHPVKSVLFGLGLIAVIVYLLLRLLDCSNGEEARRDPKSKNSRLD